MTITQLQEHAVAELLLIPAVTKRGSGYRQARTRNRIHKDYLSAASRLGYSTEQVASQWQDILDMVALEKVAD